MLKIFIVRHGETEMNVQKRMQGSHDSPLTERGRANAEALAGYFADIDFDYVVSSPSKRAATTAGIICHGREIDIHQEQELREIYMAHWEGKTMDELKASYPEEYDIFWCQPHLYQPTEGESYYQVQERAVNAIKRLIAEHEQGNILVVTHTVVIKSIVAHYRGYTMDRLWEPPFVLDTSVTVIEAENGEATLVSVAERPHIKEEK